MPIHIEHLLTLAYIARTGSMTRAAKLLGKTQPAISTQIKLLSSTIGEPVIIRNRKGIILSPAGEALLPSAQIIARAADIAEQISQRLQGIEFGELRIACTMSISAYFLPPVLELFHRQYASIKLKITNHTAQNAISVMENGNADLAIVHGPVKEIPPHYACKHVIDDETVLAVRHDHPLAKRKRVNVGDLNGLSLLSRSPTSATSILIKDLLERANIKLENKFELVSTEAIKEAILHGFGGGFLPYLTIQREVKAGNLVALRIKDGRLQRPLVLIHPQETHLSPRAQAFLTVLDQMIRQKKL